MQMKQLDDQVYVSPQILPEDVKTLAAEGFTCVMCNRPDGEEPGQPTFAEIAAAAEAEGMTAVHVPLASREIAPEVVSGFAEAMRATDGKLFAYCRSGTRSEIIWGAVKASGEA